MAAEGDTRRPSRSRAAILIALTCAVSAGPSYSRQPTPLAPERSSAPGSESRNSPAPGTPPSERSTAQPGAGEQIPEPGVDECMTRLSLLGVNAQPATAPLDQEACVVAMPIRLEHVTARYGPGSVIRFPNRPLIDCRLAEPLARWLGEVVAPVFAAGFSSPLKAVRTGPGYECRTRNREATGKTSAHAIGMALDISGFELANGQIVSVGAASDPGSEAVLRTVRTAACGWFTTILGPGSDAMHADHLHVDVLQHGSDERLRICE